MGADEEGERHSQRHSCYHEPDEERNRRACAKGVAMPKSAAKTFPTDSLFPARIFRVRSGVKKERTIPTPKTTRMRSSSTLGTSKTKNSTAEPRCVRLLRGRRENVNQPAKAAK